MVEDLTPLEGTIDCRGQGWQSTPSGEETAGNRRRGEAIIYELSIPVLNRCCRECKEGKIFEEERFSQFNERRAIACRDSRKAVRQAAALNRLSSREFPEGVAN